MRISRFALFVSVAAGTAMALPAFDDSAWAVQDVPATLNGVTTVCTGVGSAKDNPAWNQYPVKLVFANTAGEDMAREHVSLMQGGKIVMQTDCDAPWLLIKAPAGSYSVKASLPGPAGRSATAAFSSGPGAGQKTVTLEFAAQKPMTHPKPMTQ